jgi:hypothetical protein
MRPVGRWLRRAGDLVMVTTRSAYAQSPAAETAWFRRIALVDSYQSAEAEQAAAMLAWRYPVTRVVSSNEFDLIRAARLRERLGLPGQSVAGALAYRDKLIMRRAAVAAGISCPRFADLTGPDAAWKFADRNGYPVVLKPRRGAGTEGITVVWSRQQLGPAVAAALAAPGGALIEEHVDAPMCHVDGLAAGHEVIHCWPSRYSSGGLEAVQRLLPRTGVMLDRDDPHRPLLQDFAARIIKGFGGGGSFAFHIELWVRPGDVPVLCEATSRGAVVPVVAAYEHAFGVNLFQESFLAQAGLPLNLTAQPAAPRRYAGWACFLTGQGTFTAPPAPPLPVVSWEPQIRDGAVCQRARLISDTAVHALVDGAGARQAASRQQALAAWWQASHPWGQPPPEPGQQPRPDSRRDAGAR